VDRAYRVGQKNDVVVYRLNTCGTVEEKIYRKQVFKTSLSKTAVKNGNNMRYFTRQDLSELFLLGNPRVSETQVTLEVMHKIKTHCDSEHFARHVGFASTQDIFGVSDHDMLYCIDDEEIGPDLVQAILKVTQEAEAVKPPATPRRQPPSAETPRPKTAKKSRDENDRESALPYHLVPDPFTQIFLFIFIIIILIIFLSF